MNNINDEFGDFLQYVECYKESMYDDEDDDDEDDDEVVIWDLFGGLRKSVYNALKDIPYVKIYTFDIVENNYTSPNYVKIDLSQDDIIEKLNKFPKPKYIFSSPPCDSFSAILFMKGGGTCCWKYNDNRTLLIERSQEEFEKLKSGFTKHLKWDNQIKKKILGEKLLNNTIKIIDYFKPNSWYIENPNASLMWKYIKLNKKDFLQDNYCFNKVRYINYDFVIDKPTIFLSNRNLNLDNEIKKTIITEMKIKYKSKYNSSLGNFNYMQKKYRSMIPPKLIQTIFKKFENTN